MSCAVQFPHLHRWPGPQKTLTISFCLCEELPTHLPNLGNFRSFDADSVPHLHVLLTFATSIIPHDTGLAEVQPHCRVEVELCALSCAWSRHLITARESNAFVILRSTRNLENCTLQGINISYHGKRTNHLQECLGRRYVNSQEGTRYPLFLCSCSNICGSIPRSGRDRLRQDSELVASMQFFALLEENSYGFSNKSLGMQANGDSGHETKKQAR